MAAEGVWTKRESAALHRIVRPVFYLSLTCKIALSVLGIVVTVVPSERWQLGLLFAWSVLASAYLVGLFVGLVIASRFPATDGPPRLMEIGRIPRIASVLTALISMAVGVYAAVQHTLVDVTSPSGWDANLVGIWAMILAWFLLHWALAQVYLQQYYRFTPRSLAFPHDGSPGTLEFAYFSFGIAVSLAVSDVAVRTSRARMLVLAHTVLSFFFNGLIIVTALAALGELAGLR